MKRSGKNLLLYAIVLGLMAAGAAGWYITTAEAAANPTEPVVVAKTRIPARAVITEDLLVLKKMPRGAVHPESSSSMAPFIGKTAKQSMAPSEQILTSKLFKSREQSGLAYVLPEGRRAIAVNINERSAAGGLIVPGDHVDVIGSCTVTPEAGSPSQGSGQTSRSEVVRSVYAMQNLEVLAVAQEIEGEEPVSLTQSAQARSTEGAMSMTRAPQAKPIAKTLTMALTPDESQKLILLESHPSCSLRLALRSAGDNAKVSTATAEFNPATGLTPIVVP